MASANIKPEASTFIIDKKQSNTKTFIKDKVNKIIKSLGYVKIGVILLIIVLVIIILFMINCRPSMFGMNKNKVDGDDFTDDILELNKIQGLGSG